MSKNLISGEEISTKNIIIIGEPNPEPEPVVVPLALTEDNFSEYVSGLGSVPAVDTLVGVKDGVVKNAVADNFAFNNRFVIPITTTGEQIIQLDNIFPEGKWIFCYVIIELISQSLTSTMFSFVLNGLDFGFEDTEVTFLDSPYVLQLVQNNNKPFMNALNMKFIDSSAPETSMNVEFYFSPYITNPGDNPDAVFNHYLVFERIA